MPVFHPFPLRRISQTEFAAIAFAVMDHVFAIHNEFGRFFDERIYKRELAARMSAVSLEAPVTVSFDDFSKVYHLDVMVGAGSLFEFKTSESIHPRHRGQTINYLLLADLEHAKLINVRPEKVQHEFVNCSQRLIHLRHPRITDVKWDSTAPGSVKFRELLMALIHDWGAGLELALYEEALTFFLGGEAAVNVAVPVSGSSGLLGDQPMRLVTPDAAFKLTALSDDDNAFAIHAQRLLAHTPLKAIHWVNLTHHQITFTTIR
ncbi:MAG: GxxExxY protein [Verrucomicrobiota bacterium]